MSHPVLRLFDGIVPGAPFRFDLRPTGATPRPVAQIREDVERAAEARAGWIVLEGPDPLGHPDLTGVLQGLEDLGLRARMTTLGEGLGQKDRLERLRDAGLAQLTLVLYGGSSTTHDDRIERPGALDEALQALEHAARLNRLMITLRFVLLRDNVAEVGALVERARGAADRIELVRLGALTREPELLRVHGVPRREALGAVQAAWQAARVNHVKVVTEAFATWPEIPLEAATPLQPVDLTLLELLRAGVPVPAALNGTWATPPDGDVRGLFPAVESARGLGELGLQLAAWGHPALDLPPSLGGLGLLRQPGTEGPPLPTADGLPAHLHRTFGPLDTRPLPAWQGAGRTARVHVVNGPGTDSLLALSTFPSLARRLADLGAQVTHHSVWDAPFNPHDRQIPLPDDALVPSSDPTRPGLRFPDEIAEAFAATPPRHAFALRHGAAWLAGLDLSHADLVVVGGFENGFAVATNPTLPATARVVIADFHLMTGVSAWQERWMPAHGRPMEGGWWPDERFQVHALFPRSVRVYWRSGVPLRQVAWRPYPLDLGQLPSGPSPVSSPYLLAGGSHQRDWETLGKAWTALAGRTRPLALYTKDAVPAPLQSGGEIRLLHFYEAIANARFVVLPLVADPRRPAGISVIAMALASGRPVIATATPATVDHLHHGVNAILVPPDQPVALARAIERLDQDDALLERLAEGARASAQHLSVATWAEHLLDGMPAQATWPATPAGAGPFRPWQA